MEVVEVSYRPDTLSFDKLVRQAQAGQCTQRVFTTTPEQLRVARGLLGEAAQELRGKPRRSKASDQLYYLERSPYAHVPLTPLQARRVNAALKSRGRVSVKSQLSPRQIEWAERLAEATPEERAAKLRGLQRPDRIEHLAEYEAELHRRW